MCTFTCIRFHLQYPTYLIFWHKLVLGLSQNLHSPHCGMYRGITASPERWISNYNPDLPYVYYATLHSACSWVVLDSSGCQDKIELQKYQRKFLCQRIQLNNKKYRMINNKKIIYNIKQWTTKKIYKYTKECRYEDFGKLQYFKNIAPDICIYISIDIYSLYFIILFNYSPIHTEVWISLFCLVILPILRFTCCYNMHSLTWLIVMFWITLSN